MPQAPGDGDKAPVTPEDGAPVDQGPPDGKLTDKPSGLPGGDAVKKPATAELPGDGLPASPSTASSDAPASIPVAKPDTPEVPGRPAKLPSDLPPGGSGAAPADPSPLGASTADPTRLRPPQPLKDALDKAVPAKPVTPMPDALPSGLEALADKLPAPADAAEAGKFLEGLKDAVAGSQKP